MMMTVSPGSKLHYCIVMGKNEYEYQVFFLAWMVSQALLLRGRMRFKLAVGAMLISLNISVLELMQVDAELYILR